MSILLSLNIVYSLCDLFYVSQSIFLSIFVLFPLPIIFLYVYPSISQHCVFPLWPFLCLSVYLSIHLCLVSFAHHLFVCLSFYLSTLCIPFVTFFMSLSLPFYPSYVYPSISQHCVFRLFVTFFVPQSIFLSIFFLSFYLSTLCFPFVCDLFYVSQSILLSIYILFPLPTIFLYVYPSISQHCVFPLFVTFFMSLSRSFYPSLSCFLLPIIFFYVYPSISQHCVFPLFVTFFMSLSLSFYPSLSCFLLPTIFFYVYPSISQHCVFPLFVTFFRSLSLSFYPSMSCFLCPPSFCVSILLSLSIVYSLCL